MNLKLSISRSLEYNHSENEDAISYRQNGKYDIYALSDGAGGAGIFCGAWARFMVGNQNNAPYTSNDHFSDWFLSVSKYFHDDISPSLTSYEPLVAQKFYEEGSYATLLFIWLHKETRKLYFTGCGDSTMFLFELKEDQYITTVIFPINVQSTLDQPPKLLNWRKGFLNDLILSDHQCSSESYIMLCTDSMSRWVICNLMLLDPENQKNCLGKDLFESILKEQMPLIEYLKEKNEWRSIGQFIDFLVSKLKDDTVFKDFIKEKFTSKELEQDDISICIRKIY